MDTETISRALCSKQEWIQEPRSSKEAVKKRRGKAVMRMRTGIAVTVANTSHNGSSMFGDELAAHRISANLAQG